MSILPTAFTALPLPFLCAVLFLQCISRPTSTVPVIIPHYFARNSAVKTCQKPTNITHRTDPAIIMVHNVCSDTTLALCLENKGSFHSMRKLTPHTSFTFPTQVQDCWSFSVSDCKGRQLMVHSMTGSRIVRVGCTADDIEMQAADEADDISVDCVLTTVPRMEDVFKALQPQIPAEKWPTIHKDLIALSHEDAGFLTTVPAKKFVSSIYAFSVWLLRHGVPKENAMAFLTHAFALVVHTNRCKPFLAHGGELGIPNVYFSVYGMAAATEEGKARNAGMWERAGELTAGQKKLLEKSQKAIEKAVESGRLPANIEPPEALLISKAGSRTVMESPRSKGGPKESSMSKSIHYGDWIITKCTAKCNDENGPGWTYWKASSPVFPPAMEDCCSETCVMLDYFARLTGFELPGVGMKSCCESCNAVWCNGEPGPSGRSLFVKSGVPLLEHSEFSIIVL